MDGNKHGEHEHLLSHSVHCTEGSYHWDIGYVYVSKRILRSARNKYKSYMCLIVLNLIMKKYV